LWRSEKKWRLVVVWWAERNKKKWYLVVVWWAGKNEEKERC
jgi:hypothetical protein